jgi:chromate transporter
MATGALIRRTAIEQEKWLDEAEYARQSSLCSVVPGMNLLSLTILIGYRVAGTPGVVISLLGLLLPSVSMALLITAAFIHLRHNPAVQKALTYGIVPATVGLGLYTTGQNALALLRESGEQGKSVLAVSLALIVAGVVLFGIFRLPVFGVLVGGGVCGAIFEVWYQRRYRKDPPT